MAKTIRMYFLHKTILTLEDTIKYLNLNTKQYNYVWEEKEPDYLFVSEHIYLKKRIYKKFLSLLRPNTVTIYCAGECIEPDLNLFDYAIVFDRNLRSGDRIIRMPAMYFHKASVRFLTRPLLQQIQNFPADSAAPQRRVYRKIIQQHGSRVSLDQKGVGAKTLRFFFEIKSQNGIPSLVLQLFQHGNGFQFAGWKIPHHRSSIQMLPLGAAERF